MTRPVQFTKRWRETVAAPELAESVRRYLPIVEAAPEHDLHLFPMSGPPRRFIRRHPSVTSPYPRVVVRSGRYLNLVEWFTVRAGTDHKVDPRLVALACGTEPPHRSTPQDAATHCIIVMTRELTRRVIRNGMTGAFTLDYTDTEPALIEIGPLLPSTCLVGMHVYDTPHPYPLLLKDSTRKLRIPLVNDYTRTRTLMEKPDR